ncbi:MAG: VWA domain-containing protein [Spongiibacteraceae bacterium]
MNAETDQIQRSAELWFAAWLGERASCQWIDCQTPASARASFAQNKFRLPRHNPAHHRASVAHFYAHARFGGAPFAVGKFRPIQIVLTSLFEDARVEQLVLRERPGLRRLWAPYIDALHLQTRTKESDDVAALLRRLAVALFDPAWPNNNPWVNKARRLFYARESEWQNPALSRELGNLLGNDLGQMRLQFNWKSYVVEPAYRDDHRGLWIDDDEPPPLEEQQAGICPDREATRIAAAPIAGDTSARRSEIGDWLIAGAAPVLAPATLPEWDYARQFYRAAWVSVREQEPPREAPPEAVARLLEMSDAALPSYRARQHAANRRRHRRGHDGDSLDLDACIRNIADRRLGQHADMRIYRRLIEQEQPGSLLILIDTSLSMGAPPALATMADATVRADPSALDHAKVATLQMVEHTTRSGNRCAIYGFCSDGRHALHMAPVKNFSDNYSSWKILTRLAGLSAAYSTRLGGALRYARKLLADEPAAAHEIFVFTDGEASDIDTVDPRYLREDACQAVHELQRAGIEVEFINASAPAGIKSIKI